MPNLDLGEKAEAAIVKVIRDALAALEVATPASTHIAATQIFTSFSDNLEVIRGDHVSVNCQGGPEDGHKSGNERLLVSVKVRTPADIAEPDTEAPGDRRLRHRANAGQVFDALKTTTIAADLSAAVPDFTVFDSVRFRRGASVTVNRFFQSELILDFACAPSAIA